MSKVHLILFYTKGPPFDVGLNLEKEAEAVYSEAIESFDSVQMYTPEICRGIFKDHEAIFTDQRKWVMQQAANMTETFEWSENWAAINFLLWKPSLINHLLNHCNQISNDDIIFYHDINITRYPEYLTGIKKWKSYILKEIHNNSTLLFTDYKMKLKHDVKRELLERSKLWNYRSSRQPHIWAGAMAFRKDSNAQKFVSEWLDVCLDINNLSPVTSYQHTKKFIKHSQEQACLSVLYYSGYKSDCTVRLNYLLESRSIPPTIDIKLRFPIRIMARFIREWRFWSN